MFYILALTLHCTALRASKCAIHKVSVVVTQCVESVNVFLYVLHDLETNQTSATKTFERNNLLPIYSDMFQPIKTHSVDTTFIPS